MSGKRRPETKERATDEGERPVIWTGVVPPARWFGKSTGRFDLVTLIMVALLVINAYFEMWIISILLVTAIVMRWYLLQRQKQDMSGEIEHEISPKGIRRGTKQWEWDEFSAWTVLKTKNKGVLDLVLRGVDGRTHTHIVVPEAALPYVEPLLDKRLTHYVP
jgi:hypothetical protein